MLWTKYDIKNELDSYPSLNQILTLTARNRKYIGAVWFKYLFLLMEYENFYLKKWQKSMLFIML